MRACPSLFPLSAAAATAFFLVACVIISADFAIAGDPAQAPEATNGPMCSCPSSKEAPGARPEPPQDALKPAWRRNKFAGQPLGQPASQSANPGNPSVRATLDRSDRVAALEVVQVALSQVGDGSSYVWHRAHGRLSGIIQPTASFKRDSGQICRHLIIMFASGEHSRKMETIACRLESGIWQIDG